MSDCISREGVSAWLDNLGYHKLADLVMDKNRFPSADRPQGEWVPISEVTSNLGHKCSNCGEKTKKIVAKSVLVDNYYCNKAEPITEYTHKEQLSKFCPNCGCRMKGVNDASLYYFRVKEMP